jgi:hypothetical protein
MIMGICSYETPDLTRATQLHNFTSQMMTFFIVTTAKTKNLTKKIVQKNTLILAKSYFIVIWKYTITFRFWHPVSQNVS